MSSTRVAELGVYGSLPGAGLRSDREALDRIKSIAQKTKSRLSEQTTAENKLILLEEMLNSILSNTDSPSVQAPGSGDSTDFEDVDETPFLAAPPPGPMVSCFLCSLGHRAEKIPQVDIHQLQNANLHGTTVWQAARDDEGRPQMGVWNANLHGQPDPAMWMSGGTQVKPIVNNAYMQTLPCTAMHTETQSAAGGAVQTGTSAVQMANLGGQTSADGATDWQIETCSVPRPWV